VIVMRAGFGTSTGMNSSAAVPTRKPTGRSAWRSIHARWDARSAKVKAAFGMRSFSPLRDLAVNAAFVP
jgi:hypothetical protein